MVNPPSGENNGFGGCGKMMKVMGLVVEINCVKMTVFVKLTSLVVEVNVVKVTV